VREFLQRKELLSNNFVQRGESLFVDHELLTDRFSWKFFSFANLNVGVDMIKELPSDKDSIGSFSRSKQELYVEIINKIYEKF